MEEENYSLSAEELARIDAVQNEVDTYTAEVMASVAEPEAATAVSAPSQPTQTPQPTQQQEQPATEAPRQQSETTEEYYPKAEVGDYMTGMGYDKDTVRERLSAAGVGLYDFAVDSINKLSNWFTGKRLLYP